MWSEGREEKEREGWEGIEEQWRDGWGKEREEVTPTQDPRPPLSP